MCKILFFWCNWVWLTSAHFRFCYNVICQESAKPFYSGFIWLSYIWIGSHYPPENFYFILWVIGGRGWSPGRLGARSVHASLGILRSLIYTITRGSSHVHQFHFFTGEHDTFNILSQYQFHITAKNLNFWQKIAKKLAIFICQFIVNLCDNKIKKCT